MDYLTRDMNHPFNHRRVWNSGPLSVLLFFICGYLFRYDVYVGCVRYNTIKAERKLINCWAICGI